jgi:hypothetical protein
MDNFIGFFRKLTANKAKINKELVIGNKTVFDGTGKTFFVDSGASNAANTNNGRSWASPLATIAGAIAKCTANQGDVIVVAEGHTETYTTTGAKFVASVAGIAIVGLGAGSNRPTISYGHTGTTATISAANVTLQNLLFVTAVDSVVTYATISGADCTLLDVEMRDATDKEVISDFTITGDRFKALRCFKNGYTGGNANARVFSMNGVDNAVIKDCRFMTKVTTAVINFITTACTNVVVDNCKFLVSGTTDASKNIVDTITGSTWLATRCSDLGAGASFSGGSGAAIALDDVSTVITNLANLQADMDDVVDGNLDGMSHILKVTIADGTAIPNNSQAAGGLLATASGDILVEEIIWQRGATNFTGPTNYEFSTDNANGLTGADAPVGVALLAKFNANTTNILSLDGSTKQVPFVLEDTKKLYIHGDDAATGAGGTTDFYIKYRPIADDGALA